MWYLKYCLLANSDLLTQWSTVYFLIVTLEFDLPVFQFLLLILINVNCLYPGEYVYHVCLSKLTRGILPYTTPHSFPTSVSWDSPREGPQPFLFTLCFLEAERKSCQEISAKEIRAKV